jgi:Zn-dependent M28 family amino/carboxypeptidase
VPKIPAAALTIEASSMMGRMAARGDRIVLELAMAAREEPDALSHNLVGELVGREHPEEIVLVSGHIDAWDVGQGAQDDGAGCTIALAATLLLRELGIQPRRTIRVVLWTNEENGLRGATQYVADHAAELPRHIAAIESDSGNGIADGFRLEVHKDGFAALAKADSARSAAEAQVLEYFATMEPILAAGAAANNQPGGSGADVGALARAGVLGIGMNHDTSRYFDVHHTRADTFEKIVQADLDQNVAAMALLLYCLAESAQRPLAWPTP